MCSFKFSVCVLAEAYIYIFAFSFLSYVFSGIYCLISINNKIVLRHLFYKMWLVFLKFTLLPFGVGLADLTNISYDAVCLFSYKSQMKFKREQKNWHTRRSRVCNWCSYNSFFTICYFTDPPQHKIYLFCMIKKGKSCLSLTDRKEEPVKNHISFNLSHN